MIVSQQNLVIYLFEAKFIFIYDKDSCKQIKGWVKAVLEIESGRAISDKMLYLE